MNTVKSLVKTVVCGIIISAVLIYVMWNFYFL